MWLSMLGDLAAVFRNPEIAVFFFAIPGGLVGLVGLFALGLSVVARTHRPEKAGMFVVGMVATGILSAVVAAYQLLPLLPWFALACFLPVPVAIHLLALNREHWRNAPNK